MPGLDRHNRSFSRPHLWLIRLIGVIVPRRLRADWRQEWEAELRSRETLLVEWDRLDWRNKLDLLRRSLGAFRDALLLRPKRLEDEMFQDLHSSMRMLLRHKVFTAVAVLAIALPVSAHPAWGIVVDSQKRIVFTDVRQNAVWRVETDGRLTRLASGIHSHDLWIDVTDNALYGEHVYWIETEQRFDGYKWRLAPDGALTRIAEIPERVKDGIDRQGRVLRSDGLRVIVRHGNGETMLVGGHPFAGLPHNPDSIRGLTIAEDDSVYVADSQYRTVWKIAAGGAPEPFYRSGYLWIPTGVAAKGNAVYVLEDRPNGPLGLLSVWAGPRVIRLREGVAPELVMAIDFTRHYVILGGVVVLLAGGAFGWYWKSRRRSRLQTSSGRR